MPWCGQCFENPDEAARALLRELDPPAVSHRMDIPLPETPSPPAFWSRWHATFGTLGPRAKIATTAVLVLGMAPVCLFLVAVLLGGEDGSIGDARPFALTYLVLSLTCAGFLLAKIWRRERVR